MGTLFIGGFSRTTHGGDSEEMRDAGNIDPHSVLTIDVPGWTVAAAPAREREKSVPVFFLLGRQCNQ